MRITVLGIVLLPFLGLAQSHPSWWTYASPEATALVGVDWKGLKNSPFGDAFRAELGADGLGFPDLKCIDQADQILISAPELLAVVSGACPAAAFDAQAGKLGFAPVSYKGVNAWISSDKTMLSVAQVNDQLLLVGSKDAIADAIDRGQEAEAAKQKDAPKQKKEDAKRKYSPLLARAAQFSHDTDLWIVAERLPDPLANRFVPLTTKARGFDGYISVRGGLTMNAALVTKSNEEALVTAERLRGQIQAISGFGKGIQVQVDGEQVTLQLVASPEELRASLREPPAPPAPDPPKVAAKPAEPSKPIERPVIRIVGLDDGPVEIPLDAPPQ